MSVYTDCPPWVLILEDTESVRGPGWYQGDCLHCGVFTTGAEPVVEEWASEHWDCREASE
ncbi:hypothetical protein ACFPN7_33780 [Amycolatopsis halotolerans]|uniref:hypothetical protein n=1 Tax=Amycolatopsis halotolerans TaxID=330083 RepID=UPI003617026F